jgi:hypothetical protein
MDYRQKQAINRGDYAIKDPNAKKWVEDNIWWHEFTGLKDKYREWVQSGKRKKDSLKRSLSPEDWNILAWGYERVKKQEADKEGAGVEEEAEAKVNTGAAEEKAGAEVNTGAAEEEAEAKVNTGAAEEEVEAEVNTGAVAGKAGAGVFGSLFGRKNAGKGGKK